MAVANLVLQYVKALLWPTVVLAAIGLFKVEFRSLLKRLRSFGGAGFNAEFGEEARNALDAATEVAEKDALEDAEDRARQERSGAAASKYETLYAIADVSPENAVIAAWRLVELKLREAVERTVKPSSPTRPQRFVSAAQALRTLRANGLGEDVAGAIENLMRLRNEAAHSELTIAQSAVRDYIRTSVIITDLLDVYIEENGRNNA